ncbi:hypothetical protein [Labrenzia sp. CE80]|uniref:hypothetical protein n=1 Tax=Labrenzia sp. CE80 TaxID=1788986 RepID=UPI00129A42F4|nr:hypothetical protein [Labrenzia sp. CE80]
MRLVIIFVVMCVSYVHADTIEVPLLPDGSVDVETVLPSFSAKQPVLKTGDAPQFEGSFLGQSYSAVYDDIDLTKPFELTISSQSISEHAYYLIAVSLNNIICLNSRLRPDMLLWHETAVSLDGGWKVTASCSKYADPNQN